MMASTVFVRAGIDEALRDEAALVLAEFGLTVSDVVRMTLTRVAKDRAVPLELKVPNGETQAAMAQSRRLMKKQNALFNNPGQIFQALDREARKR